MSEFTKGEWQAVKHNCSTNYFTVQAEDKDGRLVPIANMTCHHGDEKEDNARLIAAAPDMYEALEKLLDNPLIASYYTSHKDMDMAFAEEVPSYKADCESITKCFDACIEALAKGESE